MLLVTAAKRRPVVALLLTCLTLGGLTLILLAGPSSIIQGARMKCAALRLGMSEAEFESVLGAPAAHKGKLFGRWMDADGWYATRRDQVGIPGEKLYEWRQWDFGYHGKWSFEFLYVGALLDEGQVIGFWSGEHCDTAVKQWLRQAAGHLSIDTNVLSPYRSGVRQARKPPP